MCNRFIITALFFSLQVWISCAATPAQEPDASFLVAFYTENLAISYDEGMEVDEPAPYRKYTIVNFYKDLETRNFSILLESLQGQKESLRLNDLLYYQLIKESVEQLYAQKTRNYQTLMTWFFMTKSGYDARLTHRYGDIFLYAYIDEAIFETPVIEIGRRKFVNLSDILVGGKTDDERFFLVEYVPNPTGKAFSLKLENLPLFKPEKTETQVRFSVKDKKYLINYDYDNTLIRLFDRYPLMEEKYYLGVPLSDLAQSSLVKELKKILEGKTEKESIEILLALTRSGFVYKEDNEYFGKSKPMIAEEVFFYKYSDCEDRSALLYTLVKELLDLPMIIVAYPNHLTIGIDLADNLNKPLRYRGNEYTICDPTGPTNSAKAGIYPEGYEHKEYEVIGSFR